MKKLTEDEMYNLLANFIDDCDGIEEFAYLLEYYCYLEKVGYYCYLEKGACPTQSPIRDAWSEIHKASLDFTKAVSEAQANLRACP